MNESQPSVMPTGTDDRPQEYRADTSFDELGLSPELRRAVAERGYTHPTPVQARAWEAARNGKDLIVRSKTGTGKTAAFGLPIIDQIPMGTREVRALVLCPTRELALQVNDELASLAKHRDIAVTAIYGGASMHEQQEALRSGSAIIVGTPGRVHDHIRRGNLKLNTCTHAVLDEADEMLNQGFYEEVTRILDHVPKPRQVMLFSATVPEDIERLIARYTDNPETLLLSGDVFTVDHINHIRYEVSDEYPKPRNLLYALEMEDPDNAIVFCNTRDDTELVTAVLNRNGFDAEMLNGDLAQKERERVMGRVKRGELAFMVATDIAARGIDISDLGHVINYSLPEDPAVYLHRVGRTGRIGKKGTAINLTSGRELATLTTLEKKYGIKFDVKMMPKAEEATKLWTERHVRQIKEAAQGSIFEGFLGLANSIKARQDADELIAFMLRFFFTHQRMDRVQQQHVTPPTESKSHSDGGKRPSSGGRGRGGEKESRPPSKSRSRSEREFSAEPHVEKTRPPPAKGQLSDREMFALLEAGKPLPPVEDPTANTTAPVEAGAAEAAPRRRERKRREEKPASSPSEPGLTRLWLNLGKTDNLGESSNLVTALEGLGAPTGKIAKAELRGTYSYVHVADADAAEFETLLGGKSLNEKEIKIERARR